MRRIEKEERERKKFNSGPYVLPAMPKGSSQNVYCISKKDQIGYAGKDMHN